MRLLNFFISGTALLAASAYGAPPRCHNNYMQLETKNGAEVCGASQRPNHPSAEFINTESKAARLALGIEMYNRAVTAFSKQYDKNKACEPAVLSTRKFYENKLVEAMKDHQKRHQDTKQEAASQCDQKLFQKEEKFRKETQHKDAAHQERVKYLERNLEKASAEKDALKNELERREAYHSNNYKSMQTMFEDAQKNNTNTIIIIAIIAMGICSTLFLAALLIKSKNELEVTTQELRQSEYLLRDTVEKNQVMVNILIRRRTPDIPIPSNTYKFIQFMKTIEDPLFIQSLPGFSHDFECPISKSLIELPITAEDGMAYDLLNFLQFLNHNRTMRIPYATSPSTGVQIGNQIVPNVRLRSQINDFCTTNLQTVKEHAAAITIQRQWRDYKTPK